MNFVALRDALQCDPQSVVASDESCLSMAAEAETVARYIAQNLDKRYAGSLPAGCS